MLHYVVFNAIMSTSMSAGMPSLTPISTGDAGASSARLPQAKFAACLGH
jgi:hypothetical protein